MWFCSATADVWALVPAKLENGQLQMAPDDVRRLGSRWLQIAECRVDGTTVLVLFVNSPELTRDYWRNLPSTAQAKFDGAPLLVVLDAFDGHLRVDTSFCDHDEAQRLAAFIAAAVIWAKWSLDESTRIRIEAAEQVVEVEPRCVEKRWWATIVM
jgi:hypothetical protein